MRPSIIGAILMRAVFDCRTSEDVFGIPMLLQNAAVCSGDGASLHRAKAYNGFADPVISAILLAGFVQMWAKALE